MNYFTTLSSQSEVTNGAETASFFDAGSSDAVAASLPEPRMESRWSIPLKLPAHQFREMEPLWLSLTARSMSALSEPTIQILFDVSACPAGN